MISGENIYQCPILTLKYSDNIPTQYWNLFDYHKLLNFTSELIMESDPLRLIKTAINHLVQIANINFGCIVIFEKNKKFLLHYFLNDDNNDQLHLDEKIINIVKLNGIPVYHNLGTGSYNRSECSNKRLAVYLPLFYKGKIFGILYIGGNKLSNGISPKSCIYASLLKDFLTPMILQSYLYKTRYQIKTHNEEKLRNKCDFKEIIGHHPKFIEILEFVSKVADTNATVLIQGESGTGKEVIAKTLHQNSSRKSKPFIPINCAALPENLLESELFGYVRGAFTGAIKNKIGWFEAANGGTIFLDEISEMPILLQVKLLRVLQTGEFNQIGSTVIKRSNVRIIAATAKNLKNLVKQGKFREDVFYRLNIIDLNLPPLRDRKSDIMLLASYFLKQYEKIYKKNNLLFSKEFKSFLLTYNFPGNIRELENIIQRAVVLTENNWLCLNHVDDYLLNRIDSAKNKISKFSIEKKYMVEKFEKGFISDCLKLTHGNIRRAATNAGIDIKNFYSKMTKYKINPLLFK